jgi:hypothetical protein
MRLNGFEERMTGADGQQFLDELLSVIDFETGGCFEFGKLTLTMLDWLCMFQSC